MTAEFLFERAPFPSCHASTIAQTRDGLIAAWFGGAREGAPDVGIWVSRHDGNRWGEPVEVARGADANGAPCPTWNPVLFQPSRGPLLLFYKVGPGPAPWWGMVMGSRDGGATWSRPERLPDGIFGPIKNKPIELPDGTILCGSSTEDHGWRVHFERSEDGGATWTTTGPVHEEKILSAIQPSILVHPGKRLEAVGRTRNGRVFQMWSVDGGRTWRDISLLDLPNPNSGTDAVTLADGRHLLVYNHSDRHRYPLNVAVSENGVDWKPVRVLEDTPGEYSYPAVIQATDGRVHITYTWRRERIKHVVLEKDLS